MIAFPNVDAKVLERTLTPLSKIPDMIQVIFITLTSDKADLVDLANKSRIKALHVRGKVVAMWARHLSKVGCNVYTQIVCNVYTQI